MSNITDQQKAELVITVLEQALLRIEAIDLPVDDPIYRGTVTGLKDKINQIRVAYLNLSPIHSH